MVVNPSQAPTERNFLKFSGSSIAATKNEAVTAQMPAFELSKQFVTAAGVSINKVPG